MALSFFLQSKKNPAPIYVRIREGRGIDAKAKTNLKINPDHFVKGKTKNLRMPSGADIQTKKLVQETNMALNSLQEDLDLLRFSLTTALNNRKDYETINSDWLKEQINPCKKDELPVDLIGYFDYYYEVKKNELKPTTLKKNKSIRNRVEAFQKTYGKIYIQEVNRRFSRSFQSWCDKENYANNTKLQTLKVIKTICYHAKENGIPTHPELEYIAKGLRFQKAEHIHLSFEDIKKIVEVKLEKERLDTARDWLVISCYTAQRVSDFLYYSEDDVTYNMEEKMYMLNIKQDKTEKPVSIPLVPEVVDILKKRDGKFPPIFSKNEDSNEAMYNRAIKEVCRLAKVNDLVEVQMKNPKTKRNEEVLVQKFKAVSSHIGRRSFATNFYGRIKTPLLISATGHSTEAQFLRYVGRTEDQNAVALGHAMRGVLETRNREPQLKVVKAAVNEN
ncbi:phage integrase SAM-like domain-containing protein [Salinimicrobium gaetbulicola]|uniref:Phage integrase SAM-like domain-containing protein n=1 Tax=Salinimicrobium gaetbulicola TaxID=999702 RepID=A0ABW3IK16_9FLAO